MSGVVREIVFGLAKRFALRFLKEERVGEKLDKHLTKKFEKISGTGIGKELGVSRSSSPRKLPITNYDFYRKYFENPHEGDFLFPLIDYVKVSTSGTMGKPKSFLLPKSGIQDNLRKTGFATMLLSTHDGEGITFEVGDVAYTNLPGGSHISAYLTGMGAKMNEGWVVQCPDLSMPFHAKVEYFIENYEKIDVAFMNVTTLLDEIYPRIGKPFHLKGLITQDISGGILKERIKEIIGTHPKVTYSSTETMYSTLPSIDKPGCFFFDWRVIYPEFLPEEQKVSLEKPRIDDPPEAIPMMDVEVGKRYQLIMTMFKNDMTRYAMPDILECAGKCDEILNIDIPMFRYYARADKLIVLHNFTRIAEEELIKVLSDAGIPFVDFTARKEAEGTKEYMAMYLELSTPMPQEETLERIHRGLVDFDKDWRDLTDYFKYTPLKLKLLPKGTFSKYLRTKEGMPRIERIEMKDEHFGELMRVARNDACF